MIKRMSSVGILLVIIILGFLQKDDLLEMIKQGGNLSILISMLMVAICVFFPIIPFPVLAGVIGAVFGATLAVFISLAGAIVGTMAFFFLSRYGFRDFAVEKLAKYPKITEYEEFLNRNSFVAILTCRLIPIIPAPIVNIICGLSGVKWIIFFVASTLGKIPNILILSYAGSLFSSNKLYSIGIYGCYVLIIFFLNLVIIYRRTANKT
ncbi:TVP38/TMEM64 family protein [Neobacillus jeddahensis]|uniref:TVP38/TMEM64 family protein n=1 Tax=Neobacillus jeddahensis TaxID=1461580 RepID=UPI0005913690|nr:TVP38/TMEM64 family protein [Neobacillus jeddahensis]